jgi:hypothetical protein
MRRDSTPRAVPRLFVQSRTSQEEFSGQLLNIGPETLTLLVDGRHLEVPLDNVLGIQTRGDSVWNGARVGSLVAGLWCAFV